MLFQTFVANNDIGQSFDKQYLIINAIFTNKLPSFMEAMVLIFCFKSIFQRNELISLVLAAKQQKAIQST